MDLFKTKALLRAITPILQTQRFRGKINIQRPRKPHYEREKLIVLTKPKLPAFYIEPAERCIRELNKKNFSKDIENPYQRIIAKDIRQKFDSSKMVAIFHANPFNSDDQFKLQILLKKENMVIKKYGKKTLKLAFEGTGYGTTLPLFDASSMIIFSEEPKVAKLLRIVKKSPQLTLIAGIIDNRLLHKNDFVAYSKLPDLQTARAGLAQTLLSAGIQLTTHLNHHQNTLVQHLQSHIEQIEKNTDNKDQNSS